MSRISKDVSVSSSSAASSCKIPIGAVSLGAVAYPIKGTLKYDTITNLVYYANGTVWQPVASTGAIITLGGDAFGPSDANTVIAIQNQPVSAGSVNGQVLVYNSGTNSWVVNSATLPVAGNILAWNGTSWVPVGGTATAGQILTATGPSTFAWGAPPASITSTTTSLSIAGGTIIAPAAGPNNPAGFTFGAVTMDVTTTATIIGGVTKADFLIRFSVVITGQSTAPGTAGEVYFQTTPNALPNDGYATAANFSTGQSSAAGKVMPTISSIDGTGGAALRIYNMTADGGVAQTGQVYRGQIMP